WDSPAVFGTARDVAAQVGAPTQVIPVSISYPEGDPGREDEMIQQIADHWQAQVHWLHSTDMPILDEPVRAARQRDLPWAHLFEQWNRAMPRALAALDARVLLSGYGGDQLFQVSDIYLADLFWSLRWVQLRQEWIAKRGEGIRRFFKWAIEPGLPRWALGLIKTLRGGRALTPYINRIIPDWFRADFPGREELELGARDHEPSPAIRSRAEAEGTWYLTEPTFPRVNAEITAFALEADVEHRAPLYDRRIVEFVATRPWTDRTYGKETKRLLRAASKGLVPDPILAPRESRTGTTDEYAKTAFGKDFPELLSELRSKPLRLAELGIVDGEEFDAACENLRASPHTGLELPIFLTAQTELWLRGLGAESSASIGATHEQH
ncbi:MAG: asparagine synthetase B (glutamine-hydrolyzing), partial [Myxococcota bacterium]